MTVPDVVKKAIEYSSLTDYVPQHAPPVILKLAADGAFDGPVTSDVDLERCLHTGTMDVITFYAEAYRSGNDVSLILHPQDFAVIAQTTDLVRAKVPVTPRSARIRSMAKSSDSLPIPKILMPIFTPAIAPLTAASDNAVKDTVSEGSSSNLDDNWEDVVHPRTWRNKMQLPVHRVLMTKPMRHFHRRPIHCPQPQLQSESK